MSKRLNYCFDFGDHIEKMIKKGEFLGNGHNGIVLSLPNNKVIKLFSEHKVCKKEYYILKKTEKSKHFPKVYEGGENYIIRDFVGGERLDKHLKHKGMNRTLAHNILELIKEFKRLKFKKLDIRCKDIYVLDNNFLMVIDPKNNYSKEVQYPRHLMKGLNNLGLLEEFLIYIKDEDEQTYEMWKFRMNQYLDAEIK